MEYAGTRILDVVRSGHKLLKSEIQVILCAIANAIKYIRNNCHVHRNIKPNNVLLSGLKYRDVVLCDLGIAAHLNNYGKALPHLKFIFRNRMNDQWPLQRDVPVL
ncbi:hypothetical protein BGX29_005693 [Mortierella sp. GBA35]|nr:hypothetical protein BGX29_005693 [Mortierella sp. GBA35]